MRAFLFREEINLEEMQRAVSRGEWSEKVGRSPHLKRQRLE
ncbi:MAG: hypothetical protein AAFR26_21130 [Cyanobacteria bacterium J06626_4]